MRSWERKIEVSFGIALLGFAIASAIFSMATNNPAWVQLILGFAFFGAMMIHGKSSSSKPQSQSFLGVPGHPSVLRQWSID
jgi:hypothetical protein